MTESRSCIPQFFASRCRNAFLAWFRCSGCPMMEIGDALRSFLHPGAGWPSLRGLGL